MRDDDEDRDEQGPGQILGHANLVPACIRGMAGTGLELAQMPAYIPHIQFKQHVKRGRISSHDALEQFSIIFRHSTPKTPDSGEWFNLFSVFLTS